jgi:hypothetical protein
MKLNSGIALQNAARLTVKLLVVTTAVVGGGALVSSSVFASLTAVATASTTVTTGTLKLTDTATGVTGGLVTTISAMAPGDTVNRYVDLVNGGTLNSDTTTVIITGSGNTLTSDATNGLQVFIQSCPGGWTVGTGVCGGGGVTTVLATTSANALLTSKTLTLPSFAAGATTNLKIAISLPSGTEVTTNGVLPGGTIQGLSTTLGWTFTEQQRVSTSSNS